MPLFDMTDVEFRPSDNIVDLAVHYSQLLIIKMLASTLSFSLDLIEQRNIIIRDGFDFACQPGGKLVDSTDKATTGLSHRFCLSYAEFAAFDQHSSQAV